MQSRVYLVGIKHAGKSTVGRRVATAMDVPFIDQDTLIQTLFAERTGKRVATREVFRRVGRERFAELELDTAVRMASTAPPLIAACGGGVADNEPVLETLSASGRIIALVAPFEGVWSRVIAGGIPAFLDTDDQSEARNRFEQLARQREQRYRSIADAVVEAHDRPDATAMRVQNAIEELERGRK